MQGARTGRWRCSHFALRAFANLERLGLDLGVVGCTCKDRSQDQRHLIEGFFFVLSWKPGSQEQGGSDHLAFLEEVRAGVPGW